MITYKEVYYNSSSKDYIVEKRLELVRYANVNSIRNCSKVYHCSRNTIKKWCKRYAVYGKNGLFDNSKVPYNMPRKLDKNTI